MICESSRFAMALVPTNEKLQLLNQAAREAGIQKWNCPTLSYLVSNYPDYKK